MLIFNSKIEKPEYLEELLVGRKKTIDVLEKEVTNCVKNSNNIQYLLVGNRGCGKTHLLRVLYNRISINETISNNIKIAYLAEEEIGIDSFFALLVRIIESFIRWSDNLEEKEDWRLKIDSLKIINPSDREENAKKMIISSLQGKQLFILAENINEIFTGMKPKGQARLRDFIQRTDKVNFIATSQTLFSDIQNEDKPFHNFFQIVHLKRLNEKQTKTLLVKMATIEKANDLIEHLSTPQGNGQARAIHFLSEGNHRLIALFFEFLKSDIKSNLTEPFLQTLDKLKPYYESFLRHLPPQQQKIVQFLAIKHQPQLGSTIAKECFLTPGGTSKQMNELKNKGFVDAHRIGRDNKYELTEPMMRYCIELTNNRDGIIGMFARFISILYSDAEIINKYLTIKYQLTNSCDTEYFQNQEEELNIYRKAGINQTQCIEHIEKIISKIEDKCTRSAIVKIMMDIHKTHSKCSVSTDNCECNLFLNKNTSIDAILKIFIARLISYSYVREAFHLVYHSNTSSLNNDESTTTSIFFVKCLYEANFKGNTIHHYLNKLLELQNDILSTKLINVLIESQFKGNKQAIYDLTKDERAILAFIDNKGDTQPLPQEMLDIHTETSNSKIEELYKLLIAKFPNDAETHIRYASFLSNQDRSEEAEKHIIIAIEQEPQNAEFKYNYANFSNSGSKEYSFTKNLFLEAIKLKPTSERYWLGYVSFIESYEKSEAKKTYQEMEKSFPDSVDVLLNHSSFLFENNEFSPAIKKLNRLIENNTENIAAYELLGNIYTETNKFNKAIQQYSTALEFDKNDYEIITKRGIAYFENKDYKLALNDFRTVTSMFNEEEIEMCLTHKFTPVIISIFNLYILGIINNKKKDIKLASKHLDNNNLPAYLLWAYTLLKHVHSSISELYNSESLTLILTQLNSIFPTEKIEFDFSLLFSWITSTESKRISHETKDYLIELFDKIQNNTVKKSIITKKPQPK